jgi:methylenetetrahydrofolate reductase (NADPH)
MLFAQSDGPSASPSSSPAEQDAITDLLTRKVRTISAEVIPPRNGAETQQILSQIDIMKAEDVDFISVTKGAGGSLRGGTLPIAQLIRQKGIRSLAHFTCRDYSINEVENALVDHHYFGVRNILALRGDPPDGQTDNFDRTPGRHTYAYELVGQIAAMNRGEYILRPGFDKVAEGQTFRPGMKTDFCIGVAAYPEDEPFDRAVEHFRLKVEAGAHFGITQMIYSPEAYARFITAAHKVGAGIPVLPGLRVITTAATAERMVKKFRVNVPQKLVEMLAAAKTKEEGIERGLEFTIKLCEQMLKAGAPGIHVFIMNDALTAARLMEALR